MWRCVKSSIRGKQPKPVTSNGLSGCYFTHFKEAISAGCMGYSTRAVGNKTGCSDFLKKVVLPITMRKQITTAPKVSFSDDSGQWI